jgi:hypothetical protein
MLSLHQTLIALEESQPRVLLAVLARNKAHVLERYLNCIDSLDYNKKLITIYINTNNNQDSTKKMLEDWVVKNGPRYEKVIFESHEEASIEQTRPHEWSADRFKLLASIRNRSLQQAKEEKCDYYFVVDCDNFIIPCTLQEMIKKDKPIIAPLLKAIPERQDSYSNYFCRVTPTGYYENDPDYLKILGGEMRGTFQVPVVHCTYLIKAEYLSTLNYLDGTDDYEFVIFSRLARQKGIDQYICNEKEFGTLIHFHDDIALEEEKRRVDEHFQAS